MTEATATFEVREPRARPASIDIEGDVTAG